MREGKRERKKTGFEGKCSTGLLSSLKQAPFNKLQDGGTDTEMSRGLARC